MKKRARTANKQDARITMLTGEQLGATRGGDGGGVIIVQNLTPGNGGVIIVQN
jgi:hypothetical protein